MRRLRAQMAVLLGPALAPLVLGACAAIPTSGSIQEGPALSVDPSGQVIRVIARPPSPGMSPQQIVRGFLDASASFDGDHAVARQYLTTLAATIWDPAEGVRVYDLVPDVAAAGTDQVRVTASLSATIDFDGALQVISPSRSSSITFDLELQDGEWRINSLPNGLLLSRADVDRSFRSYDVYFFNPAFDMLVPDPRMLPVLDGALTTSLTRALLAGPSAWLAPAVTTGFPDGTSLAVDAVTVESGVARVDLDQSVLRADDATRRAISAQVVWTLKQVPGVIAIELRAGGQPFPVSGIGSPQSRDAWSSVDPDTVPIPPGGVVVIGGRPALLTADGITQVDGWPTPSSPALTAVALSSNSAQIAGLDQSGTLWVGDRSSGLPLIQVLDVPGLSRPTFDRSGALWTVAPDGGVRIVTADRTVVEVPVEGLGVGTLVQSVVPAPDGTRAAVIAQRGARRVVLLARIVTREGVPSVTGLRRIEPSLTQVIDVSWDTATRIAVLGSNGASAPVATLVDVDRPTVRSIGAPPDAVSIAAAPGQPVIVGTTSGRVWRFVAGEWQPGPFGTRPTYAS
jgi:hypothetical protein